jgi:hypothetical protein
MLDRGNWEANARLGWIGFSWFWFLVFSTGCAGNASIMWMVPDARSMLSRFACTLN